MVLVWGFCFFVYLKYIEYAWILMVVLEMPSEPCIRGHRSSKCQHFDRLMMKVPKAGRPLARCPHPKGTCSCRKTYAVMVRIPKG